jgi:hypothetical protein
MGKKIGLCLSVEFWHTGAAMRIALVSFVNHVFDEVILSMRAELRRMGHEVAVRRFSVDSNSLNIMFGVNKLAMQPEELTLPPGSIVCNLEQISSPWITPAYVRLLGQAYQVWDYSPRNVDALKNKHGLANVRYVPIGYAPQMDKQWPASDKDIDVLFYGALNERRKDMLEALDRYGLKVFALGSMYGARRDAYIRRARIILNVHYYMPATLEVVRLGHLWANRCAVLSERAPDTEVPGHLENACLFAPYDELPAAARRLIDSPELRRQVASDGHVAFTSLSLSDILADALLGLCPNINPESS